jgi:polysaccharide biosynthesis/export protein
MKKLIHRTALSFFKYSIFTVMALAMAGCSTEHYYDSTVPPAAYTPQQDAAMQAVSGSLGTQSDAGSPQQPTILRQGDTVKISFPGSANLDQTEQIRLDGKISLPLLGDVQAAGMTPEQLQQNLVRLYAPQISSSDVTVAIESSAFPVYVTGCVLAPGRILSSEPITALEAIMEAGGFDYTRANLRKIHVIRRQKDTSQSYVLNLKDVLNGDDQNNFFLQPDDIVYVPEKFSWF